MPVFDIKSPDGETYEVNAPEGATEKEALSYLQNHLKSQEPEPEAPVPKEAPKGLAAFAPAVVRGTKQLGVLGGDILPAMAGRVGEKLGISGSKEYADKQMAEAATSQKEIEQQYPSAVPSFTDIKGANDAFTYVVESVGELLPSMIPSIFTGGAAGIMGRGAVIAAETAAKDAAIAAAKNRITSSASKYSQQELIQLAQQDAIAAGKAAAAKVALKYEAAGAVAGSAAQNVPDAYQSIAESTGKEDLGAALVAGSFNSVLDAITPLSLLRRAHGTGLSGNEITGAWLKRLGKGAAEGFLTEGATESVQEMSNAAAEKYVDQHKDFFTKENFIRFIDAGLKGGLGGGVATGVTNVAFGKAEPKPIEPGTKEEQKQDLKEEEKAATEEVKDVGKMDLDAAMAHIKGQKETPATEEIKNESVNDGISGAGSDVLSGRGDGTTGGTGQLDGTGLAVDKGTSADNISGEGSQQPSLSFEQWLAEKSISLTNIKSDQEFELLKQQYEQETGAKLETPPTAEAVKEEAQAEQEVAKEEPVAEETKEEVPAKQELADQFKETEEEELDRLSKAPRSINTDNQKKQNVKQEQAKAKAAVEKDKSLDKTQKENLVATQNYLVAGGNSEAKALEYLAYDLASGAKANEMLAGTGGIYATRFYNSLNEAQKATVDILVEKHKKQLQKAKLADKDRWKRSNLKDDAAAQAENYNKDEEADLNGELRGHLTETLLGRVLRGDMRGALEEIAHGKGFSALDRAIAMRLLAIGSFPALHVVPEARIDGRRGRYNAATDIAYIGENSIDSHSLLHEALHGYTLAIVKAHVDGIKTNKHVQELIDLYEHLKANNPELASNPHTKYGMKDVVEFISESWSNPEFQEALNNIQYKRTSVFSEFARKVLQLLGITPSDKFTALASALISVDKILGEGRKLQVENPPPATAGGPKAAPKQAIYKGINTTDEWRDSLSGIPETPKHKVIKSMTSVPGVKNLVRLFQNERYPIKNWEDLLEKANKIIHYGDGQNNIYTQISLSTGRSKDLFNVFIADPSADLYDAMGDYAKARKISTDDALKELHMIFVALHEPERRHMKYLMSVPLTAQAADERQRLLNLIRSDKIDEATAKQLRPVLEQLVAENKMLDGFNDEGTSKLSIDEMSEDYNVVGIKPEVLEQTRKELYEPNKAIIANMQKTIQALHEATKELNKKANYWSKPVNNIVAFYNFDNYVPFKGRPGEKENRYDALLDFDSEENGKGREHQEAEYAFGGRTSESNNPVLQTLSDGVRAALRAGRGGTNEDGTQFGITQTVKNSIQQKLLAGKIADTISFGDRYMSQKIEKLKAKGESIMFHYNPDGSIDILQVYDKNKLEAIRRTYQKSQPLIDALNNITSFLGQLHTRYNVAFAPMNFMRDALTNAFTIGAELGPAKAAQLIGSVASKVANGGLIKAAKVARLYETGKFDEIAKMGEKDPYIKAMYEYIVQGGKVSYLQGLAIQSHFEKMQRNLGQSKVALAKDQVDGVIDLWVDMFELASRTAAYQLVRDGHIQDGMNEKEAQVRSAGYVKNLANFEQVGTWGRAAGAAFMFFRPSATGAIRAIESLVPLWRNPENAWASMPESVRSDAEAKKVFFENMAKQKRAAAAMSMGLAGLGATMYLMALSMVGSDDDDRNKVATDDMARWARYARFHLPGTDTIVQIPWGFGLGAFAAAGAQVVSFGIGNNSVKDTLNNIKDIGMDSFLPLPISRISPFDNPAAWAMDTATPSLFRPFLEYTMNLDGLGREIYNNRQTRTGDAYTGGDNIPEAYKDAAKLLANITDGAVDWSPNTMYFFANNYADGLTRMVHSTYNLGLLAAGEKDFNPKTDTLVFDSFFGAPSNFDARQFSSVENQIKEKERVLNMFKNDPEKYVDYISEHPLDQGIVDIYNKGVNGDLKKLREMANKYRAMPGLTPKERKEYLDNIKEQQNLVKRNLINMFEAYDIKP